MTKKTERLLLFAIILIFLALRIAFITQKNLWFDEVFSWNLPLGSFYEIIVRTSNDIHPPLYYFILKIWNVIFGDSVFSMRFLSALFSTSSILFIYPLSRRVLNPVSSIMVLLFFAINPLNVFYSQEARMSAMNLFLNAGSVYFFLKMLDKEQLWKSYFKQPGIYLYIIFRTLALYTHYFSFFIFIVEIILALLVPRRAPSQSLPIGDSALQTKKKNIVRVPLWSDSAKYMMFLISFVFILVLYIPWIPIFLEHITRGQSWRYEQLTHSGLTELLNFVKDINLGLYYHYSDLNLVYYITIFLVLLYGFSILQYFILLFFPKRRSEKTPLEESLSGIAIVTPFFLVTIPILIGLIISFRQKIEFYRYLSILVPYVIIFTIYGVTRLKKNYLVIPVLLVLMFINIYGLSIHYSFDFKNDDYRPLIRHIEINHKAGDRIYVEPHYMGWSIDYYKKQWNLELPNPAFIRYGWNEILDSLNIQKPNRFWIIMDYSAVDTSKYTEDIIGLKNDFRIEERNTYLLAPARVELFRFTKQEN